VAKTYNFFPLKILIFTPKLPPAKPCLEDAAPAAPGENITLLEPSQLQA